MIWCWSQRCSVDRKSTRLNSSHQIISYAVFCLDRKSTRLNSSHQIISYAVFCLKKKNTHLNSSHQIISDAVFCFKKKRSHRGPGNRESDQSLGRCVRGDGVLVQTARWLAHSAAV